MKGPLSQILSLQHSNYQQLNTQKHIHDCTPMQFIKMRVWRYLEESQEKESIIIWRVPSAHTVHTYTHKSAAYKRQSSQTTPCARQPCHPGADGSVWSYLFDFNLMHLSPVAYPCSPNDITGIMQGVCFYFCRWVGDWFFKQQCIYRGLVWATSGTSLNLQYFLSLYFSISNLKLIFKFKIHICKTLFSHE